MACTITNYDKVIRYAAALWMRKLCSEPIVKKRPRFLSSIPNLFGRSLTAAPIRTVEEIGVIEIREECWFAFLDHFSIQWIEELGDDPHLDAYRLRNINPHSEEKRESYGSMCDCALNEHIYHLRENVIFLLYLYISYPFDILYRLVYYTMPLQARNVCWIKM